MSKRKVVYQNWIVELGFDPLIIGTLNKEQINIDESEKIEKAVREALNELDEEEKELIVHYYFMGKTYTEISEKSNREIFKLSALHKRAVKKLRNKLSKFVEKYYGIKSETNADCQICNHSNNTEINRLIFERDKTKTWKPILKILREKYSINLKTPQLLIGHEKYHI